MTDQEIFNTVVRALHAQGGPSRRPPQPGEPNTCMYRGPNGRKCAVGHLIRDEDYSPAIEGHGLRDLELAVVRNQFREHMVLLELMQNAHDTAMTPREIVGQLYDAADLCHLEWPADVPRDGWAWDRLVQA